MDTCNASSSNLCWDAFHESYSQSFCVHFSSLSDEQIPLWATSTERISEKIIEFSKYFFLVAQSSKGLQLVPTMSQRDIWEVFQADAPNFYKACHCFAGYDLSGCCSPSESESLWFNTMAYWEEFYSECHPAKWDRY